ncbi:zinc-binding dehydrogenase, partial [Kibdelosporangium lantanae]
VDVALDVAGNGVLPELIALAGGDAKNVITLADFAGAEQHGVHFSNGFVDGNAFHALAGIGELVEAGQFWQPVERTFALADIAEAHHAVETGHVRGRLVLIVN